MRAQLESPHRQPNQTSCSYVWMSPHPRTRHQHLGLFTVIHAPLRRQRLPGRATFHLLKSYKYSPGILYVVSVPPSIYRSLTPSHSFNASNEHPQEEQIYTPWGPRYDTIAAFLRRPLSYPKRTPSFEQEANERPANRSSQG